MSTPTTPTRPSELQPDTTATEPATGSLTGAHAKVHTALTAHPGATSAALAEAAGLGRSTTGKALTTLEADGLAWRKRGGHDGNLRTPDRWYPHQPAQLDTHPTQDTTQAGTSLPPTSRESQTAGQEPPAVPAPDEDQTVNEAQPQAATPPEDDTEPAGTDEAAPGDDPHGQAETASATEEPAPPKLIVVTGGSTRRLAPGSLRQLVLDHLTAHPDDAFTATSISRVIGKSSGAIANALVTLEKQGQAEQANDRPRQYQLRTHIEQ